MFLSIFAQVKLSVVIKMAERGSHLRSFDNKDVLQQLRLLSGVNDGESDEEYPGGVDSEDCKQTLTLCAVPRSGLGTSDCQNGPD